MKRISTKSTAYILGVFVFLSLIIINFDHGVVSKLLALDQPKIGADKAPAQMSSSMKIINESMTSVSDAVLPSVVSISVEVEMKGGGMAPGFNNDQFKEFFKFFGPFNKDGEDDNDSEEAPQNKGKDKGKEKKDAPRSQASGSGVIISTDGYIVTNNHVVENAFKDGIKVTLENKKEYDAKLIGTDPLTDLAVIKIEATGLKPAHLGSMDNVKVGEFVVAVGNPLGLNSTVTAGIVSAIGRGKLGMGKGSYSIENYIQTDAAINPGNSGGGLFDMNGSLIGINTLIASGTGNFIGYGFAIPIDLTKSVVLDLIDDGKINRGYIGVQIRSINDDVEAKAFGLSKVEGVMINKVIDGSAGKEAGLEEGDIILELEGKSLKTSNELQSMVAMHRAGDKISLVVWRDGKRINKTVKLKPKDNEDVAADTGAGKEAEKPASTDPLKFDELGFTVKPIDSKTKKDFDVESGVMISDVKRYGIASKRSLIPNGIITKADRKKVSSPDELKDIIDSKKQGEVLLLNVKYKESNQMIALEIPKKEG